jgi:UDP-N-acetylglucosamine:LPS N-acetylglucosamine transferase
MQRSPDRKKLFKSWHGFALAIVVWYLLIPPIDAANKVDANAPLLTWRKGVKFDSQDECEQSLKDVIQHPTTPAEYQAAAKATKKANMTPLTQSEMTKRMAESQCVAADDPRMKAKTK